MTNYIQTTEPGDIYVRAKSITLINPKDAIKSAIFTKEQVINLKNNNIVYSDLPLSIVNFDDEELSKTLTLYHPLTMGKLGEKNIGELAQQLEIWLFSYMVELDKRQQQPPTDEPTI